MLRVPMKPQLELLKQQLKYLFVFLLERHKMKRGWEGMKNI